MRLLQYILLEDMYRQRFSNQYVLSVSLQLKIIKKYSVLQKNYRIFSLIHKLFSV